MTPVTDSGATTTFAATGEQTSNGRPVVWRDDDPLPTAVQVGGVRRRPRRHRRRAVERFQPYDVVVLMQPARVFVVRVVIFVVVLVVIVCVAPDAAAAATVVNGTGSIRRWTGASVSPVASASGARASANGRVIGRWRRTPSAASSAVHRRHDAHGQAGHGPVSGYHVALQSYSSLGSLQKNKAKFMNKGQSELRWRRLCTN